MVKELGDEYSLPLRVNYNMIRGFHIQMTANKNFCIDKLPPVFIQVKKVPYVLWYILTVTCYY